MGDIEEYLFDVDGNPLHYPNFKQNNLQFADEPDNKDIFHIKGDGYDVILSLARGLISWINMNPSGRKKSLFKGKNKDGGNENTVSLQSVFGVKVKRKKGQMLGEAGLCIGFTLHVTDLHGPNTFTDRVILFEHPSEALCSMYVRKISQYIEVLKGRPKCIKLFLQTHAGSKNSGSIYKNKVLPMFESANIHVDCVEIQHNEHIKQEMLHINLNNFDCVVAMGGDGTTSKVVDGLLTASQTRKQIDPKPSFSPTKARIPLGIIPCGSTNDIARSVMGTDDITSASLYIIMGLLIPVDVCSVYNEDKFQQWCFNCQYGFAGNVLTFRDRYKSVGKRGLEPAFVKALTKAKLRSYKCDIEYVPADKPLPNNRKYVPCMQGCDVCWNEELPDENEVTCDLVQAFDPLEESNNSDTLVELVAHEDTPWRSAKGDYMNIGLFTLPGRSELAPRGYSKYTHLNDGVIDMVLVKETERKEFIRMLKRLGNSKNQFDFPFVEVIRVKEVRFRMRLPIGFNYKDYNFSEIDYEMNRKKSHITQSLEILEINELSDSDDENSTNTSISTIEKEGQSSKHSSKQRNDNSPMMLQPFPKRAIQDNFNVAPGDLHHEPDSEDKDIERMHSENHCEGEGNIVCINEVGVRTVKSALAPQQHLVGPQYRLTFAEQDRARRNQRAQKKEEKQKAKEVLKMRSVWNIDNEIRTEHVLNFRVHHGLLKIYGQGISPDTVVSEPSLLCIPRI